MKLVDAEKLAEALTEIFPEPITPGQIYARARANVIPSVRFGRKIYFDAEAVVAHLRSGGAALPGGWRREP